MILPIRLAALAVKEHSRTLGLWGSSPAFLRIFSACVAAALIAILLPTPMNKQLHTYSETKKYPGSFLGVKWPFSIWPWRPTQEEYRNVLYLILKILNRPLKWDRARLWTPTGSASTGRQSWTFEKNLRFSTKLHGKFRDVLYLVLKVYSRPLKWDTIRFCTSTGSASTSISKKSFYT